MSESPRVRPVQFEEKNSNVKKVSEDGNQKQPAQGDGYSVGLFATKSYKSGDIIIEEACPLIRLAPQTLEDHSGTGPQDRSALDEGILFDQLKQLSSASPTVDSNDAKPGKRKNDKASGFWDSIKIPPAPDSVVDSEMAGKFRGMVQAGLCYAIMSESETPLVGYNMETRAKLLSLYHPPIDGKSLLCADETKILEVAREALTYIQTVIRAGSLVDKFLSAKLSKADDEDELTRADELLKIMLVWAFNSFEGGRVYDIISRINHSCDPNAVIQLNSQSGSSSNDGGEKMAVRAATDIAPGEEIYISYLSTLLYADCPTRRQALREAKHFTCRCSRCSSSEKPDAAAALPCPFCHPRRNHQHQLDEDVQYDDEQTVHYICPKDSPGDERDDRVFQCDSCLKTFDRATDRRVFEAADSVASKVVLFLRTRHDIQHGPLWKTDDDDGDTDEMMEFDAELVEEHLRLASTVLGARHWTTNVMLLFEMDIILQNYHSLQLLAAQGQEQDESDESNMETVAQAIDILQRVYRYVESLGLRIHCGHLLSNGIIGVARALVSLGDETSQKYAAEWLEKLDGYVEFFESDGIQTVVKALREAWKRSGDRDSGPPSKKLKGA